MSDWETIIGLEVHAQLSTESKIFCGCSTRFGDEPNANTCPVCLGHPGTLPTLNAQAVHYGLMIALALECEVVTALGALLEMSRDGRLFVWLEGSVGAPGQQLHAHRLAAG